MLTAAVRDLHLTYPGQFITDVRTSCKELWENNPYITSLSVNDPDVDVIDCQYPLVHRSNYLPFHFIHAHILFLNRHLGINIQPHAFKADIHLRNEEKEWISQIDEITGKSSARFWIIVSGGKKDFTNKWWDPGRYQQVIDHFRGRIQFVQVGEEHHVHPPLEGVINLIGKTDLRQLVRLMYHTDGVVCGVTMLMHLAAAVETKIGRPKNRPCVVVAGGREPSQWEAYPHHQFLHTNGALPCCENGGCWKSRIQPLGDGSEQDNSLCLNPVVTDSGVMLPKCLDLITSKDVIDAIELYLQFDHLSSKANPNETLNDEIINIHSDQKLATVARSYTKENVRGGGI
jgi:ADP-heptose:LPS heptosyltransferase